jgi:hypothetical protein
VGKKEETPWTLDDIEMLILDRDLKEEVGKNLQLRSLSQ